MDLEESTFLFSDYTAKLQSLRQYDTGTKTEIQINGKKQKAQRLIHTPLDALFFDKGGKNMQWRTYNLFNSGAGQTGQPYVKE